MVADGANLTIVFGAGCCLPPFDFDFAGNWDGVGSDLDDFSR